MKKRKARECDCPPCTYIIENTARLHAERRRWHRDKQQRIGSGKVCICHIHPDPSEIGAALDAERDVWEEAGAGAAEAEAGAGEAWEAAMAVADKVCA